MVVALLALVGLFLSLYLTLYKFGYIVQLTCAVGSCERVQTSRWSMLFGIPVAVWGAGFYLTALGVSVLATQTPPVSSRGIMRLLTAMTGAGVLFSAYLTWLELFVIHAICIYCVASAVVVTLMFGLCVAEQMRPGPGPDLTPA
jgi:uncharacterized membrane protein